ncbi:MAG: type I-C CRISPR-associated endonuclease Cas1c [Erysipelotrichaceae bacterium]|nr:type I-C CRISPR-associated endonuclease Cas1c [Erysipelotrichaceae bacterium]
MRQLLNTLYVTSEDAYLKLNGETIEVMDGEITIGKFPLLLFESIICFSNRGASPYLMGKCGEMGINLSFFSPRGRFLSRAMGKQCGNILLRKEQYRLSEDKDRSFTVAKNFIIGKVFNCRWIIERMTRDHPARVDVKRLKGISHSLNERLHCIQKCESFESLRGYEGKASVEYFSVFDDQILNQKEDFKFTDRNKRPPTDNVNALLSFGYALLANDCISALEGVGLDPYTGFMHTDRPGRESLALDLMEELRPVVIDRLVLSLINKKIINKSHFQKQESGAVLLNDDGRKCFLSQYQERKQTEIVHPYLKEKIKWGLIPHVQAMLLSRCIRGDLDSYPCFLWK